MKFGQKPRKVWNCASELDHKFNRLNMRLSRLMVLDHVWTQLVGSKAKFWKLQAVKGATLEVAVKAAVARNELNGQSEQLIKELNKHFDKPWIKRIDIV